MNQKYKPPVSVILPTYNRANTLNKSILSVLNQTYEDFELIIVDDGSSDNTKEVIEHFEDNRIRYVKHEKNKGAASAMNTGIRKSKGFLISIQNSDDIWLPEKLESEISGFDSSNTMLGVVYSGLYQIKGNKKMYVPSSSVKKKEGSLNHELLLGNFVNGLSLIRKACFEKVGLYDEELVGLEDWEMYIRISEYYDFKFIDKPLIIAHLSPDSLSVKPSIFINATQMIITKHFKKFDKNKKALAINYGYLGSWSCLDGKLKEGRDYFRNAINLKPFILSFYFAFFASLFGKKVFKFFLNLKKLERI
ncbi:MAG: glycosyltransferase [Euryarchaeota archaeon]|nr:glycosyltransferase [Euryarchaeota archaeon]MBV1729480.1 glycosyltransferase [Methanobacterium sp.]MBV1754282.1 glycosyltransferase [Methanobacterium sp.]